MNSDFSSNKSPEPDSPEIIQDTVPEYTDDIHTDDITDECSEQKNAEETYLQKDPDGRTEIVGVKFKKQGKIYYFAPNGFTLSENDRVIVDTSRGLEYGYTAVSNREIKNSEISEPLRNVVRIATEEDTHIYEENVKKEIEAFNTCIALIDRHGLEMKLIDSELSFDRNKLIFYFSAEGRIDFRELVKDLAGMFRIRIEMRQIGIRDEAKIFGGIAICGRPYCCSTFLNDFGQVSVKMAKEQSLSLNSSKISGSCGRIMCCLRYEYDTYLKEKALTPKTDTRVMTPDGIGTVTDSNPLTGIVKVRLDSVGDEGESVAFVRDDVIEESKYSGQTLTKTKIPERRHKTEENPFLIDTVSEPLQEKTNVPENENSLHQKKNQISNNGDGNSNQTRKHENEKKSSATRSDDIKKNQKPFKNRHGKDKNKFPNAQVTQNTSNTPANHNKNVSAVKTGPVTEKSNPRSENINGSEKKRKNFFNIYRKNNKKSKPKADRQKNDGGTDR